MTTPPEHGLDTCPSWHADEAVGFVCPQGRCTPPQGRFAQERKMSGRLDELEKRQSDPNERPLDIDELAELEKLRRQAFFSDLKEDTAIHADEHGSTCWCPGGPDAHREDGLPPGRAFYLRKGGTDALIDVTVSVDSERAELYHLRDALRRIADMPTEPRPDGTYNYDRSALVQIARMALGEGR